METQGIGVLEILWKIVEAIIDTRIKTVDMFHEVLHGLHTSRVTSTAIMEIKMAQEIAIIDQEPLFMVVLDLRKTCNNLYHSRSLHTLGGYGAGPKIRGSFGEPSSDH